MKKLLVAILFFTTAAAHAQNLDTVMVRNLTLDADDVAYFIGSWNIAVDSVSISTFNRIRKQIQANKPASWSSSVTIDSLPGPIVLDMYKKAITDMYGVMGMKRSGVTRGDRIMAAIKTKTNMLPFLTAIDALPDTEFNRFRDRGKNRVID
jgi:hypothetical protein